MFNLANNITLARIGVIPFIVFLLYFPNKLTCLIATVIFFLASISDLFDGLIARKYNLVTNVGKFLDPLADKLLITSVIIMLVQLAWVEAWVAVVIVGREITVTGLRAMAADKGMVIAADKYGKLKTVVQLMALGPLVLHYTWFGFNPIPIGIILLYIALFLTVFSGLNYIYMFYTHFKSHES